MNAAREIDLINRANEQFGEPFRRVGTRRMGDPAAFDDMPPYESPGEQAHDPDEDYLTPPPKPSKAMFYGLVGDVARAAAHGTEANPVAAAMAFMSWLSARVGRDVYIPIGDVRHHIRLFTLHVGRSMIAGKGEAVALVEAIERAIMSATQTEPKDLGLPNDMTGEELLGHSHTGGLSSREGLVNLIHDGYTSGKNEVPPVEDKRLWVFESEFDNTLRQGQRDGNTLSSALRDAWDGKTIKPATKAPVGVWQPHIAVHGCITPHELNAALSARDMTNGLGNRFLLVFAERTGLVPIPRRRNQAEVNAFRDRVIQVVNFAKGGYPTSSDTRRMEMSEAAEALYRERYADLRRRDPAGEHVSAMLERRAPMVIRMAGLFALTDQRLIIDRPHLEAALAWAEYHRQSVLYVFGGNVEQRRAAIITDENARKIAEYLSDKDWVRRSEIRNKVFSTRISPEALDTALSKLLTDRGIEQKVEVIGNSPKRATSYRATIRPRRIGKTMAETAQVEEKAS